MKLESENNFLISYSSINNKNPRSTRKSWQGTILLFTSWVLEIFQDINSQPKTINMEESNYPGEIKKYSKQFILIYQQALTAEINGLTEICGLGYRKAFEFLLKDFLLRKHEKSEHQAIKSMPISQCISKYVTSDEIKLVAHRVLWLGNDQAHYLKKWKGKTLTDLKYLIKLTIKWILIKDELSRVEKLMPKGK